MTRISHRIAATTLASLILVVWPAVGVGAEEQTQASVPCGPRKALITHLDEKYSEQQSAVALHSSGGVVELMRSDTGSWTLLLTLPGGATCVLAHGEHWETVLNSTDGTAT